MASSIEFFLLLATSFGIIHATTTVVTTVETTTETLTTEMFNCEMNDTCTSTTQIPNVTSVQNHSSIQRSFTKHPDQVYKFCTCNLQAKICDINCCCDQDCSKEEKHLFSTCNDEALIYDTRYCSYTKYLYINNTPFQWDINQNGLFCVLKRNAPPQRIIQRKEPIKNLDEVELLKANKFFWFDVIKEEEQFILNKTIDDFRYGNEILMVKDGKVATLSLPNSFLTKACLIQEKILNLKDETFECVQTDISEENQFLSLNTYLQNVYFLNLTRTINISHYQKQKFQGCPKNVCIPLSAKICENNFEHCNEIVGGIAKLRTACNFVVAKNLNNCVNLVKNLRFTFHYNTKGYTKVEVAAKLENTTFEFRKDFVPKFFQTFSVNFIQNLTQRNFSIQFSGNPGYKVGKPILIARKVKLNETEFTLERNGSNYIENFLTLPSNFDKKCAFNELNHVKVNFGYNLLTKCKLKSIIMLPKKRNGTEICKVIQTNILHLLQLKDESLMFGIYGNSDANNPEDWIEILYKNSPEVLINKTSGEISGSKLICTNLVTILKINIFHSRIDFEQIVNQEKILGVEYNFEVRNTEFLYDSSRVNLELEVFNEVLFFDVTEGKVKKFVDAPSLRIRLPYDFFYPFVKIDNSATRNGIQSLLFGFVIFNKFLNE